MTTPAYVNLCPPSTSAIVSHLVSIVITRLDANDREQIVASVSTFDQALPATDYQNMVVNGTVLEHKVRASQGYPRILPQIFSIWGQSDLSLGPNLKALASVDDTLI